MFRALRVFIICRIKELCHPPVECDFDGTSRFWFNHPLAAEGIFVVTRPPRGQNHSAWGRIVASTGCWRRRWDRKREVREDVEDTNEKEDKRGFVLSPLKFCLSLSEIQFDVLWVSPGTGKTLLDLQYVVCSLSRWISFTCSIDCFSHFGAAQQVVLS